MSRHGSGSYKLPQSLVMNILFFHERLPPTCSLWAQTASEAMLQFASFFSHSLSVAILPFPISVLGIQRGNREYGGRRN